MIRRSIRTPGSATHTTSGLARLMVSANEISSALREAAKWRAKRPVFKPGQDSGEFGVDAGLRQGCGCLRGRPRARASGSERFVWERRVTDWRVVSPVVV